MDGAFPCFYNYYQHQHQHQQQHQHQSGNKGLKKGNKQNTNFFLLEIVSHV